MGYPTEPSASAAAVVADFDGDGRPDLALTRAHYSIGTSKNLLILLNRGEGRFSAPIVYPLDDLPLLAVSGDFDSDGLTDLGVGGVNGQFRVLLNTGRSDSLFRLGQVFQMGGTCYGLTTGDFNSDGITDVAAGVNFNTLQLLIGNEQGGRGDGTFRSGWIFNSQRATFSDLRSGDFNGDGITDLAAVDVLNRDYSGNFIWLFPGLSAAGRDDGALRTPPTGTDVGDFARGLDVDDLNGDGRLDLVTTSNYIRVRPQPIESITDVVVLLNQGDGVFQPAGSYPLGYECLNVVVADFTGDGRLDIAALNYGRFGWPQEKVLPYQLQILTGNGDGTFGPLPLIPLPGRPHYVTAADLDGDRRADLVLSSPDSVYVLLNRGTTSIGDEPNAPSRFALLPASPNPFNPTTTIRYTLAAAGPVTLDVFDALGRRVGTLVNEVQAAGAHTATFDGSGLPSGVYVVRLTAGTRSMIRRTLLLR